MRARGDKVSGRDIPHIMRDGKRIDLTDAEARAVYAQLERERTTGLVYDILRMLHIEPTEEMPLEAYVGAYRSYEEHEAPYVSDDLLDVCKDIFTDDRRMEYWSEKADPRDAYLYWEDPSRDAYASFHDGTAAN